MSLIIISNRLPVTCNEEKGHLCFKRSIGGLAIGLNAWINSPDNKSVRKEDCKWVGWPGASFEKTQQEYIRESLVNDYNYHPVFMESSQVDKFYNGFCNGTLWPLFHYFTSKTEINHDYWEQYVKINEHFALEISKIAREDDMIWIHDYHLLLLPRLLKKLIPDIRIGFFQHIPFPSYEIFKVLPKEWGIEILNGMLGADVIGFHTKDYITYFRDCVLKTLGHKFSNTTLVLNQRVIKADSFPMSIDFCAFFNRANSSENKKDVADLRKNFQNNKLVLSIDRLDYTKGIENRLLAFQHFLHKHPQWLKKINLVLVVVPSRTEIPSYIEMKEKIDELVGRINGAFGDIGWTPISYQYKEMSFKELVAMYNASNVALITPLRDGMNLIAKEYIASQPNNNNGVLILSEMAGASHELTEAQIINPYDIEEISDALFKALNYDEGEVSRRNQLMQSHLRTHDICKWAEDFLQELTDIKKDSKKINLDVFLSKKDFIFQI